MATKHPKGCFSIAKLATSPKISHNSYMFEGEIQVNEALGSVSRREAAIVEIIAKMRLQGPDEVLNREIYLNNSLRELIQTAAYKIMSTGARLKDGSEYDRTRRIAGSIEAGMSFACWTHEVEHDEALKASISGSLDVTRFHMTCAEKPVDNALDVFAYYETAMQHLDARNALEDCGESERDLIEYASRRFESHGEDAVDGFKQGYGFIRHAIVTPYNIENERTAYNLETLGVNRRMVERFEQHLRATPLTDPSNIYLFEEHKRMALRKFQIDPTVGNYFQYGQKLSLVEGVSKIIRPMPMTPNIKRFHAIGRSYAVKEIEGTFQGFASEPKLDLDHHEQVLAEGTGGGHGAEDPFTAGLYVRLNNASVTYDTFDLDEPQLREPFPHQVLVPLYLPGQQLIYKK